MRRTRDMTQRNYIIRPRTFQDATHIHTRYCMRYLFVAYAKIRLALDTAGILPRLRYSRGRDSLEFGSVSRALLRCRADPENPGLGRLTIGAQVWRKDLIISLLCAAGVLRSWRDRPADRWSYRSVGITWCSRNTSVIRYFCKTREEFIAWCTNMKRKIIISGGNIYFNRKFKKDILGHNFT